MSYRIIIRKADKKHSSNCWSYEPEELDYLFEGANEEQEDLELELYDGRLYELEETEEGL